MEKPDDCQRVMIYKDDVFLGERGKYAPNGDEPGEFDGSIFDRMLEGYDEETLIEAEERGEIVKAVAPAQIEWPPETT